MLFVLRLVEFFPTSCSTHGLVLTSDPTFTKHELFIFILSSCLKSHHTSLSRFHPANKWRQAHSYYANIALTDDIEICVAGGRRILSPNDTQRSPPKHRRVLLNTGRYVGRDLGQY